MGAWVRLSVHVMIRPAQLSIGEHSGKAWLYSEGVIIERLIFGIFVVVRCNSLALTSWMR